ncbi:MAG: molybdopterin molybdenumtransferase MoeA [Gemmatimonadetes bacterium]|nr:molybdopterin molybdenumtransferase MoeA [Gemmatimonadota bacterium]
MLRDRLGARAMRTFETIPADWISFPDALERVVAGSPPLPTRPVPLSDAEGLAVSHEIRSPLTLPPGPTSQMDGYAVPSEDISALTAADRPRTFRVVGESLPGTPWTRSLPPGSAVRIMTGALLPTQADRVFPVEDTDRESGAAGVVLIGRPEGGRAPWSAPGHHVRPPGEEVREGELLASPGDTLEFGLLALLATTGARSVPAHTRPRVALLVTGSELVPAGDRATLAGGLRRADVLSPTLSLLIRWAGGTPLPSRLVADDAASLRAALEAASTEADLVLTTGGASMGTADLVKDVLRELGLVLDFWRIRMRPGSPVSFGHLPRSEGTGAVPVLGLPGNPVSAMVAYLVLGAPAIRALGGHGRRFLPRIRASVREPLPGPDHLTRFFRVALDPEGAGRWGVRLSAPQGSGVIRSMALADGLAIVPEGAPAPAIGTSLEVLLLPRSGWEENR